MRLERRVEPEWLDDLPAADPDAIRSRRDLRRLNVWMGNAGIVARLLERCDASRRARRVVDLGAGDGTLLLDVARRLGPRWSGTTAILIDRVNLLSAPTRDAFARLGWAVETVTVDVLAGLAAMPPGDGTLVLANLFLHHIHAASLRELLAAIASRAAGFVACEPRRSRFVLGASHLVGLIGCNAVTRHDAVVSIQAGFTGDEISRAWPVLPGWHLEEDRAGPFSHCFTAWRRESGSR